MAGGERAMTGPIDDVRRLSAPTLPRTCDDLPATGGRLKAEPEDFVVHEIPAYDPCGEGEHLYLWVEKNDVPGDVAARRIARAYGVGAGSVGSAGNKDRRAVTRQWFSVQVRPGGATLPDLGDGIRIIGTSRHGNKLKTGHLRGNNFTVRIRDTALPPGEAAKAARAMLDRLATRGMPNFYGPQRFGRDGDTANWGWAIFRGDGDRLPDHVRRDRRMHRLALSALQSVLYNRYLVLRHGRGLMGRAIDGDVLKKADTGGLFVAEAGSLATEQERMDRGEIVHAGPIFGAKLFASSGEARRLEIEVLEASEMDPGDFTRHASLMPGTRRPDLVRPSGNSVEETGDGIVLRFSLPSGVYATVLLGEVTGPEP